jgi:hypothetical protein
MTRKFKLLLATVFTMMFCGLGSLKAQNSAIINTVEEINRNYDSVKYLSFDIRFQYSSDTLLGKFESDGLEGYYTMAGKHTKYRLGNIDFMQNDSFFIAVYNSERFILVDEPKVNNIGSQLPLRGMIDSMLKVYSMDYTITSNHLAGDTASIQFLRADSLAKFDVFSIKYDTTSKLIYQLFYEFTEPAELDSAVLAMMNSSGNSMPPMQKKRLTISFRNYRFDNYDEGLYNEANYIWFENGYCKPAETYKGYKIYYSKPKTKYYEKID